MTTKKKSAALFTVDLRLTDGTEHAIGYTSVDDCLTDHGLKALFECQLITKCSVNTKGKRITALPVMEWVRLQEQLISNSTTILRGMT